ncbi:TPA: hypothetical protein R1911_001997, partial [Escherichia coli]|nr:hypothetical protein [Escherichia coli]
ATECIAADVILDFKSGRGFYESHSLIVNDNITLIGKQQVSFSAIITP